MRKFTAKPLSFFILALVVWLAATLQTMAAAPSLSVENHRLTLANGFVHLEFDQDHPAINVIKADFSGQGHYGPNLAATNDGAAGIVLKTLDADGTAHDSSASTSPVTYKIEQQNASLVQVRLEGIQDRTDNPVAASVWTLTLHAGSRQFELNAQTHIANPRPVKAISICASLNQWFMNGLFQRGVEQYVRGEDQIFDTTNRLQTFYTMDNQNGCVAVVPDSSASPGAWLMRSGSNENGVGLEAVLAGGIPATEQWNRLDWSSTPNVTPATDATFETRFEVYPNNDAFPVFSVPANDPMDFRDRRTLYTAIYGSAAGVLGTFDRAGSAYPTLAFPNRPYGDRYTFFDPDSWSTVVTLSFSGDPYLQNQAREILEWSAAHLRHGQIPHHFESGQPTYIAISQATQTGPNIFWTLAAIDYADATGDETWLKEHYSQMRAVTDWILNNYDPDHQLVKVGGSLFIDVFIRRGYTLDSNALLLRLLPLMEAVARFCDDEPTATHYHTLAAAIKQGLNTGLWDGHDHYVTQRNLDWSIRDMVDYDGNYAAIAFGATSDPQRIAAIYRRLDQGPFTHPGNRGTWVSEKYYGQDDCFEGNTGDSATAMARIWWLDLVSRYVTGDLTNFQRYYEPVQDDLFQHTWLTERYNAQGQLIRAPYYHEYPEITAMVMREIIYGIDVKIDCVRIKPFGRQQYHYQVGALDVAYSPDAVSLRIPGHGKRTYEIYGLRPQTTFHITINEKETNQTISGNDGAVVFQAPVGMTIKVHP